MQSKPRRDAPIKAQAKIPKAMISNTIPKAKIASAKGDTESNIPKQYIEGEYTGCMGKISKPNILSAKLGMPN